MLKLNNKLVFNIFIKNLNNTFFTFLFSMGLIIWVIQSVNFLDFVVEDGHGLNIYLEYTLLNVPKILSKIIPLIYFISLFFVINKFEDSNELKIFWLIGIKKQEFLKMLLGHAFILTIIIILFSTFIVPSTQNLSRKTIQNSKMEFFPSLLKEKQFIDTVKGLTIFIEKKNFNYFENIFIKQDNSNINRIIYAKRGELIIDQNYRGLDLSEGKIINIKDNDITELEFISTSFNLGDLVSKSTTDFKIQEKDTFEIVKCYLSFLLLSKDQLFKDSKACNKPLIREIQAEIYKRIIKPVYLIPLTLIASLIIITSKENFVNRKLRYVIFFFGIFLIIISEILNSFAEINNFKLIMTIIFPLISSLYLYNFFNKQTFDNIYK